MANIYTLNEINNGTPLVSGNKLGDSPFNRYPSSRTELENQRLKHDLDIALSSGIQLGTRNSLLIKNNESFSERVCQLEDEAREFKNEINQKEISLAKELEQDVSLVQKRLSEMDFLKRKSELEYIKLSDENISLELANTELKDTLAKKKDELMRVRDDLLSAQKVVIEKDSLLQETNSLLLEHISKTSSESKQNEAIGGDKGLEKEIRVIDSQSDTQKNQKTGLPSMKLRLLDIDEVTKHESSRNIGHPAMTWPFSMLVTGRSGSDPRAPYYENISFSYIPPERIPSTRTFSPERSKLFIFEDLCFAPDHIQNRIGQFFGNGRHRNISCIYIAQKYYKVDTFKRENSTHLVLFNSGSSIQDVSKIVGRYIDDIKGASMVINSYLRKGEFVVFDLTRPEDDPLAIRLRFDTPLNLQKEIEARQKHKKKSVSANE
ncbi:hypothetical protein RIR_jg25259.t1 [Rhizophagus irregularis DAOM 181602=DAOM 197198]|nr:hypothetical protein RIR_jg25259.t1 [Rhizophagus irregularis DAOM 181602=DAOM 197198]